MATCNWDIKVTEREDKSTYIDKNGTKTVRSALWDGLRQALKSEKEADLLYRKIMGPVGDFINMHGDPYKGPWDEEKNPEGYQGPADQNGEPTVKAALEFYRLDKFMREPQNLGEKTPLTKKMSVLKDAINSIEKQLGVFRKQKGKAEMTAGLEKLRNDLLEQLRDKKEEKGLLVYAETALNQTKEMLKILRELYANKKIVPNDKLSKLTARQLQDIYEYAKSFSNIDEIIAQAEAGYIKLDAKVLADLKETAKLRDVIETEYKTMTVEFITDRFAPTDGQAQALYRMQTEKRYKKDNPIEKGESITEFDNRVKEYVDEEVQKAVDDGVILENAETMLEEQLSSVKGDIDFLQRWMLNAAETNDFILKTVAQEVNAQSDRARLDFQQKAAELHEFWEKLIEYQKKKGVKVKNPLELYDLILEKDLEGNPTKSYTMQYYSNFYIESDEQYSKSREIAKEQGEDAGIAYWEAWKKKYRRVNPDAKEIYQDTAKRGRLNLYKAYKSANARGDKAEAKKIKRRIERVLEQRGQKFYVPSDRIVSKFLNPRYTELMKLGKEDKNNPLYKFWLKALETKHLSDQRVPDSYKLKQRMGGIRNTFWEKFSAVKTFTDVWYKWIKPTIKEIVSVTEEDIEFGDVDEKMLKADQEKKELVSVNSEMEERQFIPLHFRGDPKEHQTYEVMTELLATYYTATNYHYLNQLLPYIEMLKYHMKQRGSTKTKGFKELFARGLTGDVRVTQKGEYSNAYDAFIDYIEQRIYGVGKIDPGWELGGVNFIKVVNAWMTYVGLVTLGGNYLSAKANWNLAQVMTWMEGLGSEFYSAKDVANAEKKYTMDLMDIFGDVGAIRPKSKTNLLGEIFDPLNDFNFNQYNYSDNTRLKRLMNLSSAHFLNNMAEHNVQNLTMYAVLNGTKVMNSKGEYITRGGGVTTNVREAMSLDEAYSAKNGKLTVTSDIESIWSPVFGKLKYKSKEDRIKAQIKLTNAMQQINYDLHGAYSLRNMPPFQRLWIGAMALMLRKFLAPSVLRRFGGGLAYIHNRWSVKEEELYEPTKRYRIGTQTYAEGMYVTAARTIPKLLKAIVKDLTKMQRDLQRTEWSQLSKHERANIIKTVSELGFGVVLFTLGSVLRGEAEDDEDNSSK